MFQDKAHLIVTISNMKEEVDHLNSKLDYMTKLVRMLNSGTENLDEILGVDKMERNINGVGFNYDSLNSKEKLVPHIKKTEFIMPNHKS